MPDFFVGQSSQFHTGHSSYLGIVLATVLPRLAPGTCNHHDNLTLYVHPGILCTYMLSSVTGSVLHSYSRPENFANTWQKNKKIKKSLFSLNLLSHTAFLKGPWTSFSDLTAKVSSTVPKKILLDLQCPSAFLFLVTGKKCVPQETLEA